MHATRCRQQDLAQELNVHPSIINRLLRHFRVKRQVIAHRRHRRQLKTAIRQDRYIATTSTRNSFVSASKVANELHLTSGLKISGQNMKNRLLRDVNLRARRPRVAEHLTQRHP